MNGLVGEERALKRGECWRKGKESAGARGRRARAQGKESEGARGKESEAHREGERAYFFLYIILTGW